MADRKLGKLLQEWNSFSTKKKLNEAARVGIANWEDVCKDLEYDGWSFDEERNIAVKDYQGYTVELSQDYHGGDTVYVEVKDEDNVIDSSDFDAYGLSAGELDLEFWNYIDIPDDEENA